MEDYEKYNPEAPRVKTVLATFLYVSLAFSPHKNRRNALENP